VTPRKLLGRTREEEGEEGEEGEEDGDASQYVAVKGSDSSLSR